MSVKRWKQILPLRKTTTVLLVFGFAINWLGINLLTGSKAEAATVSFTKIADNNTQIPNSSDNFTKFGDASLDNGNVAFPAPSGFYTTNVNNSNSLSVIADRNTITMIGGNVYYFPLLGVNYFSMGRKVIGISQDHGNYAFSTGYMGEIYTYIDGSLNLVANTSTSLPGSVGGRPVYLLQPSFRNGEVAFGSDYHGLPARL